MTRYEYSDPRFPTLPTKMIDAQGNTTNYSYTAEGYLQEEVVYLQGIHRQAPLVHVYDAQGQRIRTVRNYVSQSGSPATVSYDPQSPNQNIVTAYAYDAIGRVVAMTETVESMLDRATGFEYDNSGRMTKLKRGFQGSQIETRYVYDRAGNLQVVIDPLGRQTWACYDAANRPWRRVENYQSSGAFPDPGPCSASRSFSSAADRDLVTDLFYDVVGNLVLTIDPLGRKTFIAIDSLKGCAEDCSPGNVAFNIVTEVVFDDLMDGGPGLRSLLDIDLSVGSAMRPRNIPGMDLPGELPASASGMGPERVEMMAADTGYDFTKGKGLPDRVAAGVRRGIANDELIAVTGMDKDTRFELAWQSDFTLESLRDLLPDLQEYALESLFKQLKESGPLGFKPVGAEALKINFGYGLRRVKVDGKRLWVLNDLDIAYIRSADGQLVPNEIAESYYKPLLNRALSEEFGVPLELIQHGPKLNGFSGGNVTGANLTIFVDYTYALTRDGLVDQGLLIDTLNNAIPGWMSMKGWLDVRNSVPYWPEEQQGLFP